MKVPISAGNFSDKVKRGRLVWLVRSGRYQGEYKVQAIFRDMTRRTFVGEVRVLLTHTLTLETVNLSIHELTMGPYQTFHSKKNMEAYVLEH